MTRIVLPALMLTAVATASGYGRSPQTPCGSRSSSRRHAAIVGAAAGIVSTLLCGAWAYLAWIGRRGFDVTDEGYYLLASQHPEDVLAWANAGHVYTALLYRMVGGDVVALRLLGLILLAGGGHVLALGLVAQLDRLGLAVGMARAHRVLVWAFVQIGVLLYYNLRLMTPSFNLLNAAALNGATGTLLLGLGRLGPPGGHTARAGAAFAASGACLGLSFFCKFPSGLSALGLFASTVLLWPGATGNARRRAAGWLLAGACAWALLHFALLQRPDAWWSMVHAGIVWLQIAVPTVGVTALWTYAATLAATIAAALRAFGPVLLATPLLLGAAHVVAKRHGATWPRGAALAAVLIATAVFAYRHAYHHEGGLFGDRFAEFYAGFLLVLLVALVPTAWRQRRRACAPAARAFLLAALLGLLPLAGAVGTADPITVVMTWHLAPLFGLLLLLLVALAPPRRDPLVAPLGLVLVALFATSQVLSRGTVRLWHHRSPVTHQTVPTPVGVPPTTLLMSPADAGLVRRLQQVAVTCGFQPGDDVLAFYNLPGLVYAIGGRSPGTPWFLARGFGTRHHARARVAAARILDALPRERIARAFILTNVRGSRHFPDAAALGRRFPDEYERCAARPISMKRWGIGLWRPRGRTGGPDGLPP